MGYPYLAELSHAPNPSRVRFIAEDMTPEMDQAEATGEQESYRQDQAPRTGSRVTRCATFSLALITTAFSPGHDLHRPECDDDPDELAIRLVLRPGRSSAPAAVFRALVPPGPHPTSTTAATPLASVLPCRDLVCIGHRSFHASRLRTVICPAAARHPQAGRQLLRPVAVAADETVRGNLLRPPVVSDLINAFTLFHLAPTLKA